MNKLFTGLLFLIALGTFSQDNQYFEHPRGVVLENELEQVRARLDQEPYKTFFKQLINFEAELQTKYETEKDAYLLANLVMHQASIYLLTQDDDKAEKAYENVIELFKDEKLLDPFSFGLGRATHLQRIANVYDFCYNAWTFEQQKEVALKMFDLMASVHKSMGFEANYSIESNWMGVRYGAVALAASVYDDFETIGNQQKKSAALPFAWDAKERIRDHVNNSFTKDGWFVESMSYEGYAWSFIAPGIIAMQHMYDDVFDIPTYVPIVLNAFHPLSTSTVNIEGKSSLGLQADFADDDPMYGWHQYPFGFKLFPSDQQPYLKWMFDYLHDTSVYNSLRGHILYAILYYPEKIQKRNPSENSWLSYVDHQNGTVFFRNQFKDKNDIVAGITASAYRKKGHAGPDNLSFRIIGQDVVWVVGGGRTGQIKGQSNFFTNHTDGSMKSKIAGKMSSYELNKDVGGHVIMEGSVLGVENHKRFFEASYNKGLGCEAAFITLDNSENGKLWRINTPEFNEVEIDDEGYSLIGPNGSSLKFHFLNLNKVDVVTSKVRYGGDTQDHNHGVCYKQKCYEYTTAVDVQTGSNVLVVMTLSSNEQHPTVRFSEKESKVYVSDVSFDLPEGFEW